MTLNNYILNKVKSILRGTTNKKPARAKHSSLVSALKLTDKDFLSLLNVPEVAALVQRNDISGARAALMEHYRQRRSPVWLNPPKTITDLRVNPDSLSRQELVRLAEAILDYQFAPDGSLPKVVNGRIDWQSNPISSPEWLWRLNRHQWWPLLGHAYRQTGDERYAEVFVSQMTDWIRQNPPIFLKNEKSPTWRLMEAGMRMYVSWIPSFSMFYESPCFHDEHKLAMLKSMYDHAVFLFHFSTNRNHLLRESNGLLAAGIYFPEFKAAAAWRQEALTRFEREISGQIYPDGSHIEVSPGYQWLVIDELERTYDLLSAGNLSLPNQNLGAWLEKMYAVLAMVIRPDSTFPEINDGFMRWSFTRLADAGEKFGRDDFIFVGTSGERGAPPQRTSLNIADAGWVVMRSDWTKQARYLLFDTGPYGGPHGHEDKLSIEVSACGRPFIVDSGSYTYERTDPLRAYFVGSASHNTVLVDGKSQVRRWIKANLTPTNEAQTHAQWITCKDFDYAAAAYADGYAQFHLKKPQDIEVVKDVTHKRQVLFVKPDYWLVVDALHAESRHDYQLLFHAAPDLTPRILPGSRVCLESKPSAGRLLIVPVEPSALGVELVSGSMDPVQGWFSVEHHLKKPSTAIVYTCRQAASAVLATLLYPVPANGPDEAITVRPLALSSGKGHAFAVEGESFRDYILISETEGMKSIGRFQTTERVCVERTKQDDGDPWGLSAAQGES